MFTGKTLIVLACVFALSSVVVKAAETIKLPAPKTTGGGDLFAAIEKRGSGTAFKGKVTDDELATILWAATGRNRANNGWTVPMAMGRAPYAKIYVVGENGTFLYDWENHSLIKVIADDIRGDVGMQGFVKNSYYILLFTTNDSEIKKLNASLVGELGGYAVGAMSEHVYLAAGAFDLKTRFIMSVNKDEARKLLSLPKEETPHCIMTLGR
jgi:Nitroreductase